MVSFKPSARVRNVAAPVFRFNGIRPFRFSPIPPSRDQISGNFPNYPKNPNPEPGILVYRSHPSIERIFEKILSVIKGESLSDVVGWTFPVLPLRMRWGSSTLLMPPRVGTAIAEALKTRNRVMIFDDAAISGRTIQDFLTSLRAMGTTNVKILTLANRLRLPAETGAITYYWRLDVPTMGREGSCPLCQATEFARSFASCMVQPSEGHSAFMRWLDAWAPVSPLNKWHAGLDPIPLAERQNKKYCYRPSQKKYLTEIPIFRSTGLMIHAAEVHAMTASDSYGVKKLREQTDPAIKVGIAASQLLLFGNEFDKDIIRALVVDGLLAPMAELKNDSPYAPLALLVIMKAVSNETMYIKWAIVKQVEKDIDSLSNSRHGQILIAFLASLDIILWSSNEYYAGIRLLSTRHRLIADKLRSLYRETRTSAGDHHSEPIPRLIDILEKSICQASEHQVWSARNSIASLKDVITELGSDMAAPTGKPTYEERNLALTIDLNKADKELQKLLDNFEENSPESLKALKNVVEKLIGVLDCYFQIVDQNEDEHSGSFAKRLSSIWTNISWNSWDEYFMRKKITSFTKIPNITFSSDSYSGKDFGRAQRVYIPWVKAIDSILEDLVLNTAYRDKPILDPWAPTNKTADAWVHVSFNPESVAISFANSLSNDTLAQAIFDKVKENTKIKTRWDVVPDLGGSIVRTPHQNLAHDLDCSIEDSNLYIVTLKLPYAPYISAHINERYSK